MPCEVLSETFITSCSFCIILSTTHHASRSVCFKIFTISFNWKCIETRENPFGRGSLAVNYCATAFATVTFLRQELYGLGARKIGVATLPPLGCLPASITIFGSDSNECVAKLNKAAISFNNKLNVTSQNLQNKLSNLTLVVLDIYQPLYDLVTKPAANGMKQFSLSIYLQTSGVHK